MTVETVRTLRFHEYGEPADVLRLEQAPMPEPAAGTVAVRVHACGLNPADWALCRGSFASAVPLPRGIGWDVSGVVTATGDGVGDVAVGDAVFGPADVVSHPGAGASDQAILHHWTHLPEGLSHDSAAALPMVVETACRYLDFFGMKEGQTVLVNGGGTMVGFAAVQMALLRNASVIATAGDTFADRLRSMGVLTTSHGEGMVDRVRALSGAAPDFILDTAPVNLKPGSTSALPDLIAIAEGDAARVYTIADFENAAKLGARTGLENIASEADIVFRWDVLADYGRLAAEGRFSIPVSRTFALEEWREAVEISLAGRAHGKLILLPHG